MSYSVDYDSELARIEAIMRRPVCGAISELSRARTRFVCEAPKGHTDEHRSGHNRWQGAEIEHLL